MIPIISVVGKKKSGKTTLVEKLVGEFGARGYRVGTIKHDVHGFEIDHAGRDTWRHAEAGSRTVVISSPVKLAMVKKVDEELRLDQLIGRYFDDIDLIITEGYKQADYPKIEVLGEDSGEIVSSTDRLLFLATDLKNDFDFPVFPRDAAAAMADFLEAAGVTKKTSKAARVVLRADGVSIPLNPIMKAMVANAVAGLVSALKGVSGAEEIDIKIKLPSKLKRPV